MASGNTLWVFSAEGGYHLPTSNYATPDTRNLVPVLDFDTTTQETAYWKLFMPRHLTSGAGVTVSLAWMATSATSGTIGWDVAFARMNDANQDIDSLAFATAQTITAATVDGTSGKAKTTNVAVTTGANMDSVAAGEWFVLRVRRDVSNDTATGDAELLGGEIKET